MYGINHERLSDELYMGGFLNKNPMHTAYWACEFCQNGPSPMIHDIKIPKIGFSFKKLTLVRNSYVTL
jgi:hypothetical protein